MRDRTKRTSTLRGALVGTLVVFVAAAASLVGSSAASAGNKYEQATVGTWEIEDEADLFVLQDDNTCYRMDEDGIKTSKRGRWSADSKRLTMELKYNGRKYRSVFHYEKVSADEFKLTIAKAFVDGVPKEPKKSVVTAKRWKE